MDAGRLDRWLQFQRSTLTDDGFGMVETWADHGHPVWGSKSDLSDAERFRNGMSDAEMVSRFRVRSSAFSRGLTPKDRLTCEGRTYAIIGIKEVGRYDGLEITARVRAD
jgi:head-tail adaptor